MRVILSPLLLAVVVPFLPAFHGAGPQEPEPEEDTAILELGAKTYEIHCRSCHFPEGKSPIKRMKLNDDAWEHGGTLEEIETGITDGIDATQMMPFKEKLSPEEISAVARYVKNLSLSNYR